MIKQDVKDENNELIYYVDDMVLFKEGDTEEEAISGLCLMTRRNIFSSKAKPENKYGTEAAQTTKAE
eukprot:16447154-Heterocapsa_arctica.AAC.1